MKFEEFIKEYNNKLKKIDINLSENQLKQYYNYMNLLIEWNEKINLTAITEPKEIILKHFIDSLTINKYIEDNSKVIDVGTGAGFPGIPLSINNQNVEITLLDSLNKRIIFLDEVIKDLELKNIDTIHSRVEDFGKNKKEREKYDIAVSRAVAPLNVLLEYLLPLVKVGGTCICMKGPNVSHETEEAKYAIEVLGGNIEKVEKIILPESDNERNIIIVKKVKETPIKYPRKAGLPSKEPIK